MLRLVVDALEQKVLDGQAQPVSHGVVAQEGDKVFDVRTRGLGHDLLTQLLCRGVQGDGDLGEFPLADLGKLLREAHCGDHGASP